MRWRKGFDQMSDEQVEMVREIIEQHLADAPRKAALDWLDKRTLAYEAVRELGLLPEELS
jgi:hypothetical protein